MSTVDYVWDQCARREPHAEAESDAGKRYNNAAHSPTVRQITSAFCDDNGIAYRRKRIQNGCCLILTVAQLREERTAIRATRCVTRDCRLGRQFAQGSGRQFLETLMAIHLDNSLYAG
jgi:hypothetical protein